MESQEPTPVEQHRRRFCLLPSGQVRWSSTSTQPQWQHSTAQHRYAVARRYQHKMAWLGFPVDVQRLATCVAYCTVSTSHLPSAESLRRSFPAIHSAHADLLDPPPDLSDYIVKLQFCATPAYITLPT